MRTSRQMRRLADALIDPIRIPVPADPEALFEALVASVSAWRGREIVVRRETFPPGTASGLWLEAGTYDVVVVDRRAAVWHQIVILCHEVWHMCRHAEEAEAEPSPAGDGRLRPVAARTDFSLTEEQEADRFGMLMGRRLRGWLEAPRDSVYAAGDDAAEGLAGRIGAALNYRGPHR